MAAWHRDALPPAHFICEILFNSDGRFSLVSSHRSRVIQRSIGHDSISPRFGPLDARMATAVGPMARIMQGNFLVCLNAPEASVLGFVRDHPVADALSWEMLWLSPRMSMYCGSCAVSIQLTTEGVDSICLHVKIVLSYRQSSFYHANFITAQGVADPVDLGSTQASSRTYRERPRVQCIPYAIMLFCNDRICTRSCQQGCLLEII